MSSSDSGIESENGHDADPVARRLGDGQAFDLNMQPAEPQPQEQEKTLTDHLNKRLLESFLSRLDSGRADLPPGFLHPHEEREENWEEGY